MKEILIYAVLACSSLFIFGFAVHMLVGGLVSPRTEILLIAGACTSAAVVMLVLAWDVIRRRHDR